MSQQVSFETYRGSAPDNYERYFVPAIGQPLATDLIRAAALGPAERVLDVACGTGVVARSARHEVGPTGTVVGADINPGMLAVARTTTPPELAIEWHEAPAADLRLPDESFDAVLCQLGLQFFPDKGAGLREMRRVLAPGGRLALNIVGPTPPAFAILDEGLARHVGPEAASFVQAVFSLHHPDEVRGRLRGAGFHDIAVRHTTKTLLLPAPEEFLWQYVYSTPLAASVGQVNGAARAGLQRDVVGKWERFVVDGALVVELGVVVATAGT